jgi:hypothetical protein
VEVICEEVADAGKDAGLCRIYRSAILGVYENNTQKESERVPGFTGVAVENIRGLAVGEPNQPVGGRHFRLLSLTHVFCWEEIFSDETPSSSNQTSHITHDEVSATHRCSA